MATNIIGALGAGSGIDVKALAESLVEAERAPRKELIDTRIARSEARISGYGAIRYALAELRTAFEKLDDARDFSSITPTASQPAAFGVSTTPAALPGSYDLQVLDIAAPQRSASTAFSTTGDTLNNGNAFRLELSVNGGATQTIAVSDPTPTGMVSAINGAGLGLEAQLIRSGEGAYTMVVTGQSGATQGFTLNAVKTNKQPVTNLDFSTTLQPAADARFKLNGLTITRSSNTVSDVLDGVTLNLLAPTTGSARLELTRDSSGLKGSLEAVVSAYNDFVDTVQILGDRDSEVEEFGGALAGDSLLQGLRSQIYRMISADSSTPGSSIRSARDVGLSLDRDGKLTLDSTRLDAAVSANFDEVVAMFSAGSNDKSVYSSAPAGLAGDAVAGLDRLLRSTGTIARQTESASQRITGYQADMVRLEERMSTLLERYTKQYTLMETLVGSSNSLRDSLAGSFESMLASYSQK